MVAWVSTVVLVLPAVMWQHLPRDTPAHVICSTMDLWRQIRQQSVQQVLALLNLALAVGLAPKLRLIYTRRLPARATKDGPVKLVSKRRFLQTARAFRATYL